MGCLRKLFITVLLFAACSFLGLSGLGFFADNESSKLAGEVSSAPRKNLGIALREDGPAWVKITLHVGSGSTPLDIAGRSCIWNRRERFEVVTEDIRRQGTWTQRKVLKQKEQLLRSVPFQLRDGSSVLGGGDWVGWNVWRDLPTRRLEEATETAEVANSPNREPVWRVQDEFLAEGAEAWILARFEKGKVNGILGGQAVITGLGPERFGSEVRSREFLAALAWVKFPGLIGFLLCTSLALYLSLKPKG